MPKQYTSKYDNSVTGPAAKEMDALLDYAGKAMRQFSKMSDKFSDAAAKRSDVDYRNADAAQNMRRAIFDTILSSYGIEYEL